MYYPADKNSKPKHTPGGQYTLKGEEYRGWYTLTNTNKAYTGKEFTSTSKLLTPIKVEEVSVEPKILPHLPSPTESDYKKGFFFRYFINIKGKLLEISELDYIKNINKHQHPSDKIRWLLKGPAENLIVNNYMYVGAASKNEEAVNESKINNLTDIVNSFDEFVL